MGHQIIRQSDGKLALFSSVTDTIVMYDATPDDIASYFIHRAVMDALRHVRADLEHVMNGEPQRAYFQFTMTWRDALEQDREHEGEVWKEFPDV
jgi:hypothetical protein